MHILHILNHIQKLGNGIVNVAIDLACLQAKAGHTVAIASQGGDYEALLSEYGVKHFTLDQTRTPGNLIQAAQKYRSLIQTFQPDIVHAHMMTGVVLARVLRGNADYAIVSTVHNEFQRSAILMGLADRVIAVSQAVAESMERRGIPSAKLSAVFNGTLGSPRTRPVRDYQPLPLHRPAITTVAGMYHRKGITELIAAFSQIATQFPTAHLYLVGNGPDRLEFEAQAQTTGVADRIHFEGFQPEPQRYLIASDIFVLASHKEPAGLVILEAREAGCAIVASEVDGIPQGLDAGRAGILVPPKNANALANALSELLGNSEKMQFWQSQAQQNLEWLSVDRVHQETMAVYAELHPAFQLMNSVSV
jgi:glycosyltransferase involved in cell wall biosynthesis